MSALRTVTTFDEAAERTLRAMMGLAETALAATPYARRGRFLRGMVHLRPGDGYRGLVVVDADGATQAPAAGPRTPHLPSATAWRWASQQGRAVAIDVLLGTVTVAAGGVAMLPEGSRGEAFESGESQGRLLGRDATHLFVVPLRAPGGRVDGMVSIEADCRAAMGKDFIWPECGPGLELIADVAAPHLITLPLRQRAAPQPDALLPVIGASTASLVDMLRVFARQDETVLLSGPTGAGKSRLARWCHEQSSRRGQPFEALDLAAVPDDLQMAELFGWKKGAFTGAVKDTYGAIARAERGTLFIDEIDKLSLKAQAGMLRVLEERLYRPLGEGAGERSADVRFIVGTNANLHAASGNGQFREDLYYRINVLPVRVPALKDRQDEILRWAEHMLERRHRSSCPEGTSRIAQEAERVLVAHPWPGNLRQLDNIVRRAYALYLMEQPAPPKDCFLEARHLAEALAYEGGAGVRPLLELLQLAATSFVSEAERRRARHETLDLDHADALRGFVLGVATQKLGSKEEAFRLLGREGVVQNRNHQKTLKKELERVEALCRELGQPGASPFAGLSATEER
ncbi:sigma-54-dependent transcriptional regulator [Chondromyces apiculatus]|uniref:sigma-54-dependent transcriptional regulator n=1 Tax=Chondromyces apiculatus TaxID=51 RepID=UPI001E4E454F|nr:sigma 54-interacting transcriptional regulator [Chondromyces apiculatus]